MNFNYTKGNWSVGRVSSTVVSDKVPDDYKPGSGHDSTDYYGGFLIAESMKKDDAKLLSAAPEMEHALRSFIEGMEGKEKFPGQNEAYLRDVCLPRAKFALKKAGIL